jgi:hypothetical protein
MSKDLNKHIRDCTDDTVMEIFDLSAPNTWDQKKSRIYPYFKGLLEEILLIHHESAPSYVDENLKMKSEFNMFLKKLKEMFGEGDRNDLQ